MKIGFNIYDVTTDNYQTELTVEEAGAIVLAYANKEDLSTAKMSLSMPKAIIEAVYKDIVEIESMIIRIMQGESIIEHAEYNEDGEVIIPEIKNTIPSTVDELKTLAFQLIARDYSDKVSGNYTISEVEDLKVKVYYCIDQIIKYSKSTKDGNWEFFSNQF